MNNISKNNDINATISFFKKKINDFVNNRNWTKYHTPKNLIQALSIEVAELSELFLFKEYKIEEILEDKELFENISGEVADIFIYLISFINALNLDLTQAFIKKMEINEKKYSIMEFNDGNYYKK
ncbi:MAG: nucleotide pyrophosphohydrolase [Promethearchaeota archaeon]